MSATPALNDLIVCPNCDAVYSAQQPAFGERAVCQRCHTVLIAPRRRAGAQIIAVALAVLILVLSAAVFPFLTIDAGGATNSVSVLDAALVFGGGPLALVSLGTIAMILFIPILRVLLVVYVLLPVVADRPPAKHAAWAFSLSEALRPWSMAEVFAIGCAVALVKISSLAEIAFGPAFWMFCILTVLVVVQDSFLCRWSVWKSLETAR